MFILGMFWKRTTGAAAIAGLITGFVMAVLFNNYVPQWFGHETFMYTAFLNDKGVYEIPFLISMGWSFFFTVLVMGVMSLAGPKINPHAFVLDREMFKLRPSSVFLIILILLILMGLYLKFW
jgi:SSS family solute:Na+ symporter